MKTDVKCKKIITHMSYFMSLENYLISQTEAKGGLFLSYLNKYEKTHIYNQSADSTA